MSVSRRSVAAGGVAGVALTAGYVGVVAGTAGWAHLVDQTRSNWWLLAPLLGGFIVQVTLMVELRRRHRLAHAAAVSVGAGTGVSAVGMLACCTHHLAELAPLAGATGAATLLTDAQRPLMLAGVAVNAAAVVVAVHKLRRVAPARIAGA